MDDWVDEIKGFFTRASTETLELARTVHTARTQLPYGQWTELCRSRRLPFAQRTGERLIAIWERLGTLNASTLSCLPNGRSTLYLLSRLPSSLLVQLAQEGAIRRALSLDEAKELVAKYLGSGCGPKFNVRLRVGRFCDFVRSTCEQWNAHDMELAMAVLEDLASELGRHRSAGPGPATQKSFAPSFVKPTTVPSLRL